MKTANALFSHPSLSSVVDVGEIYGCFEEFIVLVNSRLFVSIPSLSPTPDLLCSLAGSHCCMRNLHVQQHGFGQKSLSSSLKFSFALIPEIHLHFEPCGQASDTHAGPPVSLCFASSCAFCSVVTLYSMFAKRQDHFFPSCVVCRYLWYSCVSMSSSCQCEHACVVTKECCVELEGVVVYQVTYVSGSDPRSKSCLGPHLVLSQKLKGEALPSTRQMIVLNALRKGPPPPHHNVAVLL